MMSVCPKHGAWHEFWRKCELCDDADRQHRYGRRLRTIP